MLINFLYFDYHSQPLFCRHFLYLLLSHLKFKFRVDSGVSKALRMPMKKLKRYFSWYEWCIGKFIHSYSLGGSKTIRRQYRQIGLVIVLHTDRGSHLRVHAIDRSGYLKHWMHCLVTRRLKRELKLRLVEENFLQTLSTLTAGISLRTNSLCI